ncbi:MAG: ATP-binding protein [Atopobiaceae bacterium]|jgi:two-component system phosphate regulon sensor histidine kinase PhoR|nr:ATP-binding protein [Atopobiaceae bacterium]MCI2172796.1 ATP-binding protein [Atopobiaceae bacterium]MCI2207103.1 ATP-binding protein [Atopobiaceae bacterium]
MARRPSLARNVFLALLAMSAVVMAVAIAVTSVVWQSSLVADAHSQLSRECSLVSSAIGTSADQVSSLSTLDMGDVRVTLVAADGTVVYDSTTDAATMPNHADRPEVASALADGEGSSERASETAGNVSVYQAVRLADGDVLRLSVDRASVSSLVGGQAWLITLLAVGLVVVSWLVARALSARIAEPVLAIDPAAPDASVTYEEMRPLVERISTQQAQLSAQVDELKDSDLMRRRFTANVTHELKTPLAGISGAAELIRDGIARPEDVPGFAGRIYDEAARLTSLVNDILTLSKLDESERTSDHALLGSVEMVDLTRTARDVAERLRPTAQAADVTISVTGEGVMVRGLPRLLDELVYNLCDNAIRYNRPGGRVDVDVRMVGTSPTLTVSDTGIGIAVDQQAKVFERFYRVDASRSRSCGGTGLGLAIVKHAATFHGATIDMKSEPGSGTVMTVTFPGPGSVLGE